MYKAEVFFVVQQFSGDASGQLRGDVSVFTSQAAATPSTSTMTTPMMSPVELCRFNIQTTTVTGEDPLVTINNALSAKFSTGTYTLVA